MIAVVDLIGWWVSPVAIRGDVYIDAIQLGKEYTETKGFIDMLTLVQEPGADYGIKIAFGGGVPLLHTPYYKLIGDELWHMHGDKLQEGWVSATGNKYFVMNFSYRKFESAEQIKGIGKVEDPAEVIRLVARLLKYAGRTTVDVGAVVC